MKKTLLATAIAGAMIASGAQAATVYDQDGTKLDIYGRIAMGIAGGGPDYRASTADERAAGAGDNVAVDNGAEFVDAYSRLGVRASKEVTSDLTAFGHVEWRFRGDESGNRNGNAFDAFSETRQSYIGLRSNSWGTVQGGNFDSFYNQSVSAPFDVYIDRGLEFGPHTTQSRGDSIGYITPNLEGFQVYLQAKHYSERGLTEAEQSSEGSVIATQGGAVYEIDNLRLAAGWVEDVKRGDGGNGENRYGVTAAYEFMPGFSGRIGYEGRDHNDDYGDGFDKVGLGMTYGMNDWTVHADIYDIDPDGVDNDSRTSWALGGYYNIASNFDVFVELQQADQQSVTVNLDGLDSEVDTADGDDMYYLVGARYFF